MFHWWPRGRDGTLTPTEAVKAGKGRILYIEITNAISMGNPFMGHQKQVSVKGRLLEDGTEIGSFSGVRASMGGAFAGFKGSCSVLGRCVKWDVVAGDSGKTVFLGGFNNNWGHIIGSCLKMIFAFVVQYGIQENHCETG